MRRAAASLVSVVLVVAVGAAAPARAAKTYDDPWLESDLQQMRVPQALDILARTPQHVVVGDVDSGARLSDPDLSPHLLRMPTQHACTDEYGPGPTYAADPANGDFGCDFVGSGSESVPSTVPDGDPTDPYGHGTGTAEIIAGVPNNGIEGAGVAPNARVLPVRACYGGNPDCFNEPALDGLAYAVDEGATVVNASWPPGNDYSSAFRSFIHSHANVLFDFAIGGSDQNDDPYTLCTDRTAYPNVLCVGLANADDTAGTTNADTTSDVSAPGDAGVPSASGARVEFGYTSGATAHVSGAAALLRGIAPDLSASKIRQVLVTTSRPVAGYAHANRAHGIVDVAAAVRAVQQADGLTTPAEGQGASADSPDPFPAPPSSSGGTGSGTTGTTTTPATTTTTTTTPAATTTATASTTPAPVATAPVTATSGPTPATATARPAAGVTLSLASLPRTIHDGAALRLSLRVTGGSGTVTATLTHGASTLATVTRRRAAGAVTLTLRVPRHAKRGRAKLTVRIGARTLVRSITVKR